MKYTTFRTTGIIAVVALVGAGVVAAYFMTGHSDADQTKKLADDSVPWKPAVPPATPSTPDPTPTATTPTTTAPTDAAIEHAKLQPLLDASAKTLRDVDHDVLELVKNAPTSDKMKDAAKGKPYKIDLHSDDGKAWNRVKIDLNRNGKWDEKWSLKEGAWHREVASADDEHYDTRFVLHDDGWKQKK